MLARLTVACVNNIECFGKIFHAIDAGLVGPRPARHAAQSNSTKKKRRRNAPPAPTIVFAEVGDLPQSWFVYRPQVSPKL